MRSECAFWILGGLRMACCRFGLRQVCSVDAVGQHSAAVLGVGLNQGGFLPLMQIAIPARECLLNHAAARQYRWSYRVAGISASTANKSLQGRRP